MNKIQIQLKEQSRKYPIHIDSGILESVLTQVIKKHNNIVIITDSRVKKLYLKYLLRLLNNKNVLSLSFPAGEQSKNQNTKIYLENKMLKFKYARDTLIIALGGGVVGDMAGFVAATYMRGIPFVQIPTTLLSMIDSSIGGKTSVNTLYGKNMIGAFWQPSAVIIDTDFLKTLTKKQLINGLIEAIKIFLTHDKKNVLYIQKHLKKIINGDPATLIKLIHQAVKIKASIVSKDEKESHQRKILNFGHTIGHALEHVTHYQMLHGFAVGLGILVEAKISELMGILKNQDFCIIQSLMKDLGVIFNDFKKKDINNILRSTKMDKKKINKQVHYVLLQSIGTVYTDKLNVVHCVPDPIVKKALIELL